MSIVTDMEKFLIVVGVLVFLVLFAIIVSIKFSEKQIKKVKMQKIEAQRELERLKRTEEKLSNEKKKIASVKKTRTEASPKLISGYSRRAILLDKNTEKIQKRRKDGSRVTVERYSLLYQVKDVGHKTFYVSRKIYEAIPDDAKGVLSYSKAGDFIKFEHKGKIIQ